MKSLTFITGNAEKVAQLSRHFSLPISHQKLDVPEIQSSDVKEVASHKATKAYEMLGSPVLVEDTSLVFNAFGKLPGPFVKWFLESVGNEGMTRMLDAFEDRSAIAEVCFAVCDESGVQLFDGKIEGSIADRPKGDTGFGWDPIFIPNGYSETWGQMTYELQHETSMRRIALQKLQSYIEASKK